MKVIKVSSLKAEEIIFEIASHLDAECVQSCDEYLMRLPDNFGHGHIRAINFRNGMGVLFFDGYFHDDLEIQWVKKGIHPLKFMYCFKGDLKHRFLGDEIIHELKEYQSYIVSNRGKNGHVIRFLKNNFVNFISLKVDRKEFNPGFQFYLDKSHSDYKKLFSEETHDYFYYQGPFTVEIWNLFQKFRQETLKPLTKRLFLEAFSYHLMVIQLLQYEDDQRTEDKKKLLRQFETDAIRKAALIIQQKMENLGTIIDLCREVGLNQNKLQSGFQLIFNSTVHEYIRDQRLKKAMYLLHNTDLNMQEIGDRVGLSSQSYFSKIFKEAYGYSPSEYRKIQ